MRRTVAVYTAEGNGGRGSENKAIVVIAVEVLFPKGFGRIRIRQNRDVSGDSLVGFICDVVEPGTAILADGWGGCKGSAEDGFTHDRTVLSDSGDPAHVAMPGVHRIAALLKRWLLGVHHGAVNAKHLDYHLDEYTFRSNRRTGDGTLVRNGVVTREILPGKPDVGQETVRIRERPKSRGAGRRSEGLIVPQEAGNKGNNYFVDADIRGYFDAIDQEKLVVVVGHRRTESGAARVGEPFSNGKLRREVQPA